MRSASLATTLVLGFFLTHPVVANAPENQLHGRFIHITDIHPDPFYARGSSEADACHSRNDDFKVEVHDQTAGLVTQVRSKSGELMKDDRKGKKKKDKKKKKKKEKDGVGRWGNGPSDCDAPLSLMNLTFDWLEKEWADKVDFVIWTGDNARHDIDRTHPRTPKEIFELNRMVAARMDKVFTSRGVTVVPSLGNNDIYPHNILTAGPNSVTNEFLDIWKHYIPAEQYHVFQRGAYFTSEVIPDKLAVISLNTLYWYDSNKAVDGCAFGSSEPGALQMDWLEVQLEIYRDRGMQVWLSGHVPPSAGNYFPDCWYRYGLLGLRYQDTIVGHTYGHMNVDHFFWLDSASLDAYRTNPDSFTQSSTNIQNQMTSLVASSSFSSSFLSSSSSSSSSMLAPTSLFDSNIEITKSRSKSGSLQGDILNSCKEMSEMKKLDMGDYAAVNVGPSVIPTYFPALRVFTYNSTAEPFKQVPSSYFSTPVDDVTEEKEELEIDDDTSDDLPALGDDEEDTHSLLPRYIDPRSPSRTNGFGTPLGYAQFYMPDVNRHSSTPPEYLLEYLTYNPSVLDPFFPPLPPNSSMSSSSSQPPPIPLHLLPPCLLSSSSSSFIASKDDDGNKADQNETERLRTHYAPYNLSDLTIPSYVSLSKKLASDKVLWKRFLETMFVGTGRENGVKSVVKSKFSRVEADGRSESDEREG
ncbi:Acid sphingomyelinase and PHM5 phosphate metabolism protein [Phaffia rhodozyma]|uniref:Endopolyphosphatase n=1 Tax=Phaffia rhodozyma TaxID=264483 RepID=A0A0F7STR1_PHARH|nr:Acid sphingomyelinase and PHM5 phosphate metabolism protein [Phaffia rhodozyma]